MSFLSHVETIIDSHNLATGTKKCLYLYPQMDLLHEQIIEFLNKSLEVVALKR